jgi:hypothetical protein
MTLGRSLLWFIIGVVWVSAAAAIVYARSGDFTSYEPIIAVSLHRPK